jgi:uncharacterized membrane protein YccC
LRNNYKIGVFFVTIMMVILMQLSQHGSLELIGWRVLSTLIGAVLAVIAGYVFWPVWEKQRFPALMRESLSQTKDYLNKVVNYYKKELPPGQSWFVNRRLAEAANHLVFASVQRMYEEPKRKQDQVDIYFAMVGVNIRMAREITSIALIVHESASSGQAEALTKYCHEAENIFGIIIKNISEEEPRIADPDFKAIKECLNTEAFDSNEESQFIKTELEKIIFELETLCKLKT